MSYCAIHTDGRKLSEHKVKIIHRFVKNGHLPVTQVHTQEGWLMMKQCPANPRKSSSLFSKLKRQVSYVYYSCNSV